jgi:predicted MPP superfamily phosphohydrolase
MRVAPATVCPRSANWRILFMEMTMRRFSLGCRAIAVLFVLLQLGCERGERDETPVTPAAQPQAGTPSPVPPDSLYGATAIENVRLVPVEAEITDLPAGWDGVRVAVLSDFQLGLWPDNRQVAEVAARKAADSGAELFVLLGDYVTGEGELASLQQVLAPLRGQAVVAVLGDRDAVTDSTEARTARALTSLGATVLRNSRTLLVRGGDTIYIAGLSPDFSVLPDWRQAEILAALGAAPTPPILFSHMPGIAPRIPESRFQLVVAGHTFCGQVEVPGTPRLSWLATTVLPNTGVAGTDRLFRVRGNNVLVTCGLGYSFVPVRLGAPPEVVIITLRRAMESTPAQTPPATVPDSLLLQVPGAEPSQPADTPQTNG